MNARYARIAALVFASAVTGFFLVAPVGMSAGGGSTTMLGENWRGVIFIFPPVAIAMMPLLPAARKFERQITIVAALLLTVSATLGLFVVGWLYFPAAFALWIAVALGARASRPQAQ